MAEPATSPDDPTPTTAAELTVAPAGFDIAAAVRPSTTVSPEISAGLADLQRGKITAEQNIAGDMFSGANRNLARAQQIFDQEGAGPQQLERWDAEQERRKYATNPIESFGSLGSVFAIVASAFTHQPMVNALNGSAAAMKAIKEGNDKEYDRAYQAWKDNTDLVIKRHNLMHQNYQDALQLALTNTNLGEAKLRTLAAQYDDKRVLFLTEHGMNKELLDMLNSRNTAMMQIEKEWPKIQVESIKTADIAARIKGLKPGSPEFDEAVQDWNKAWDPYAGRRTLTPDQQILQELRDQGFSGEELSRKFAEYKERIKTSGVISPITAERANNFQKAVREFTEKNGREPDSKERAALQAEQFQRPAAPITGNRGEQLKGHIQQYDNAISTIDKVVGIIEKHAMSAGVAGRATRLGERLGNLVGSNETDRVQMMRDIELIQAMAPQLLLDRAGRPLSAEAAKISDIVAGLNLGDTTANTLRAFKDLRERFAKMQKDAQGRLEGAPLPPAGTAVPTPAPARKPSYLDAPEVQ